MIISRKNQLDDLSASAGYLIEHKKCYQYMILASWCWVYLKGGRPELFFNHTFSFNFHSCYCLFGEIY